MPPRLRSLIGSICVLAYLGLYVWLASFAAARLPDAPWVRLVFYAVVGTAWGVPLIPLLFWMGRKPKSGP